MTAISPSTGYQVGAAPDEAAHAARLNAEPQGGVRPGPANFGVDYDHAPVDNADNHFEAIGHGFRQGQPTVEVQQQTHGQAAPSVPDIGQHGG